MTPPITRQPSWNPLRFDSPELPMELLILAKVLALVLLLTNHVKILPDPWLPFVPGIDLIPPTLFQRTLQTVLVGSALALLLNRRVRLTSLILGATILLAVVSSKAYYGNNKTFCGLALFLTRLHVPGREPWTLRCQLAITYFGAGLNKLLDGDWHSGVFFENWALNRLRQPWYIALNPLLPPMVLARFMCWTTIVTELAVVPAILIRRLYPVAIYANILFQTGLLLFTGTTFTLFFYSMTAVSLAFVTWPEGPLAVQYDADCRFTAAARKFLQRWDLEGMFLWSPRPSRPAAARSWLSFESGCKTYCGFRAMRMIVLFNPLTYMTIAGLIAAISDVSNSALYLRVFVGFCLLVLMPPLAWIADTVT